MCADLSVGPAGDELHNPIGIQVEGMDAHGMILRLEEEIKMKQEMRVQSLNNEYKHVTFKGHVVTFCCQ